MLCLTYVITIIYARHVSSSFKTRDMSAYIQSEIRNKRLCLVCAGGEKAKFKFFLDQCPISTSETCPLHVLKWLSIKHGIGEAHATRAKATQNSCPSFSYVQFFSDLPLLSQHLARYYILEDPYTAPGTCREIFCRRNTGEIVISVVEKVRGRYRSTHLTEHG